MGILSILVMPAVAEVNCGGHNASSCDACVADASKVHCNGDCKWLSIGLGKGKCALKSSVSCVRPCCSQLHRASECQCGDHYADNCEKCGDMPASCNGDC